MIRFFHPHELFSIDYKNFSGYYIRNENESRMYRHGVPMKNTVKSIMKSGWIKLFALLIFLSTQSVCAQSDFSHTSVYSPKYEQTVFAALDHSSGQLHYMWTTDKKWVKLGPEMNADGKMSLSFTAVYSAKYEQVLYAAIDRKTGQLYILWTSDKKWTSFGPVIAADGSLDLTLSAVYSGKYEQIEYIAYDRKSGQTHIMWTSDKKWTPFGDAIKK